MSEPAVAAEDPESPDTSTLAGAETIAGRYLVEAVIHTDARRVVQRALDEQLQHEIVISVFRSARDARADARARVEGSSQAQEESSVMASPEERSSEVRSAEVDRAGRESFERLATRLAAVDHPNLARMLDQGVSGVTCFIVHEWLDGETLTSRLAASEVELTRATVQSIVKQLLAALAALHAQGLAHGNLHPGAVFLQRRLHAGDAVKLLDVAVPLLTAARLCADSARASPAADETGPVLGTAHMLGGPDVLEYAAPECLAGQAPDARSDVYSVGVMLDELLLQSEPAASQAEQLERDLAAMLEASGDAEEPGPVARHVLKDPVLQALVARATATDRAERYANAAELLSALVDAEPRVLCAAPEAPATPALVSDSIYDDGAFMSETTTVYEPHNSPFVAALGLRELNLKQERPASAEPAPSKDTVDTLRPPPARPAPVRPPLAAGMLVVMVLSAVLVMWLSSESGGASWRALRPRTTNVEPAPAQLKAAEDEAPPPAVEAEPAPEAQPAAAAAEPSAAPATSPEVSTKVPAAYDPWTAPVPPELQGLPSLVSTNSELGSDVVHKIRAYINAQPNDARGHILLARVYYHRLWRKDCLAELTLALKLDPGVRGAPELLPLLLHLVADGKAADSASALIVEHWGREALPAIAAALEDSNSVIVAERFHALHDRISTLTP